MASIHYREMQSGDFAALIELWRHTPGVDVTQSDTPEGLKRFLERNPGLSFVAISGGQVEGALMCGHDGRRGILHHLAVYTPFRRQGIGRDLVQMSLNQLELLGIEKCHIFIRRDNQAGMAFWNSLGWQERLELRMASFTL